ncbi:MAG: serine--tRNA ligase [Phycisphaerae bacterium]|nr:serine--tRNA ligase [Phycisphaerae bacterium]|tara:strand:- start:4821 stop:6242 length:1422 start_codon:yes stop_codon:yes gene_type:complete
MIDIKQLRENPQRFIDGAAEKNISVDITTLIDLDEQRRLFTRQREEHRAEQKKISKEIGPQIGKLKGLLKSAGEEERAEFETTLAELEAKPVALKNEIQRLDDSVAQIESKWKALLLQIPQPADPDVPRGTSADDNVQLRTWNPKSYDLNQSFAENRGFEPKTHIELLHALELADFERGVKMSGTRHYMMTGNGMRLHQAMLRFAFDLITNEHGFTPMSVPVILREECMVGTGFFPTGREQAYHIEESQRGAGHDLFLAGTGEVGLMGMYADEILPGNKLPIKMATVSTCFRREAGAAGRDTAGLYRIHQFDKVEQVVICKADEAESRSWHKRMLSIVEELLQKLELPYRLLQCCTADLGSKNADMIDIECWMPGRGELDANERPQGDWGETHSASRLYDYQCRRLNTRYRDEEGNTVFAHSLNNTVLASPRILIPLIEMHQQKDGSVAVPACLQPYMNGLQVLEACTATTTA